MPGYFYTFLIAGCLASTLVLGDIVPLTLLDAVQYPYAKCLDGSSSGFYAATNSSNSNWMFVLEGGGFCTHDDDCTKRSKTDIGTSTLWAPTYDLDSVLLTTTDERNPFRFWNRIYVRYCDGSMWSGNRADASPETFNLWFSGHRTVAAMIDFFSAHHGLNNTNTDTFVIFSGGSAGGIGAFTNYEFVQSKLPFASVIGAPVGGFVPDVTWYNGTYSEVPVVDARTPAFKAHNKLYQAYYPPLCAAKLGPEEEYKCTLPHFAYPTYALPLFVIEAITDCVILCGFEGVTCNLTTILNKEVDAYFEQYGESSAANMQQVLNNPRDGLFGASCFIHTGFDLTGPTINGTTVLQALSAFAMRYMPAARDVAVNAAQQLQSRVSYYWMDRCSSQSKLGGPWWPPCGQSCPPP